MGIANPVTRETHGSGTHYHLQLAKQLGDMLQAPLEVGVIFIFYFFLGGNRKKEIPFIFTCFYFILFMIRFLSRSFSHSPLSQERGGMMALTEVYCLVNRARGMEVILRKCTHNCNTTLYFHTTHKHLWLFFFLFPQLLSPEDLVNACKMFESLKLPLR